MFARPFDYDRDEMTVPWQTNVAGRHNFAQGHSTRLGGPSTYYVHTSWH